MKMEHENNGGDDATTAVAVVADADDSVMPNAVPPQFNYVRRRKCNENVPICEKKKKRESFRRVSVTNECNFSVPFRFIYVFLRMHVYAMYLCLRCARSISKY